LSFSYDVTGTWKYQIGGFSTDQLLAFDLSDPSAVEQITDGLAIPAGPGFSFQFTDQVTTPVDYFVMSSSGFLSPEGSSWIGRPIFSRQPTARTISC